MKKLISILVAFAMMATLGIAMAFAAPAAQSTSLTDSKITKNLNVPAGVAAPAAHFFFTVTPTEQPKTAGLTAKKVEIPFTDTTAGSKTASATLASFIGPNDATKKFNLSQPGEYVFTVSEDAFDVNGVASAPATEETAYYLKDSDNDSTETLAKDTKQYTLRIYVINHTPEQDEVNPPALEIKSITVVDATVTDNPETTEVDEVDAAKVDPATGFVFNNVYTKEINVDEQNGGAFNLEKDVTGAGDTAKAYPFTVSITLPASYLDANDAYTLTDSDGKTWTFGAGQALTQTRTDVALAKGEKLIFEKFPAGAVVTVNETLSDTVVQNGSKYTATAAATGITIDGTDVKNTTITTNEYAAKSAIKVTNNLDPAEITPEGILISNLPYIALALVAIGGLVAYVVIRRRNADEA